MNESSPQPAPLMTVVMGAAASRPRERSGGCMETRSVARLWEAEQNISLNDDKLLNRLESLIHVGTWPWK